MEVFPANHVFIDLEKAYLPPVGDPLGIWGIGTAVTTYSVSVQL